MGAKNQSKSERAGLSTRESRLLSQFATEGDEIITVEDIQTELDVPANTAREIASRLVEKRWLDRLFPGTFLIVPLSAGPEALYTTHEFRIATHLADPMYVGYYSALDYHGLVEQVPRTVHVVTSARAPDREIHGVSYRVTTTSERKFFGFEPQPVDGTTVPISTVEKTLVDCADRPELCGGVRRIATAMRTADRRGCSWATVGEHLRRLDNGAATKRIVYLADQLGIDLPDRDGLVDGFTSGYSLLDPTQPAGGTHDSTYNLRLNVETARLAPKEA